MADSHFKVVTKANQVSADLLSKIPKKAIHSYIEEIIICALATASDSRAEVGGSSNFLLNVAQRDISPKELIPILYRAFEHNENHKLQIVALELMSVCTKEAEPYFSHSSHIKTCLRKVTELLLKNEKDDLFVNPILAIVLTLRDLFVEETLGFLKYEQTHKSQKYFVLERIAEEKAPDLL